MPEVLESPYASTHVSPTLFIFALRYLDKELASCVEKELGEYNRRNIALYVGTLHKAIAMCIEKSKVFKEKKRVIEGVVNDVKMYCEEPPVATIDEFKSDVATVLLQESNGSLDEVVEKVIFRWRCWADSCREVSEVEDEE